MSGEQSGVFGREKVRWRRQLRARRVALSEDVVREASGEIVAQLRVYLGSFAPQVERVGIYAARAGEVELSGLHGGPWQMCYPRVCRVGVMEFVEVSAVGELRAGWRGLCEPVGVGGVVPQVVICPGLGFDAEGRRLGEGGGFYDRWLAAHPEVRRVGVCFAWQLCEGLPVEAHDVRLEGVCCERGWA